ncbi:hypothetical protein ACTXT7_011927 [Hymenolepis weldensis]
MHPMIHDALYTVAELQSFSNPILLNDTFLFTVQTMLSIDKRLVLKIVVLTSIFWICVQFILLQYLISPVEYPEI